MTPRRLLLTNLLLLLHRRRPLSPSVLPTSTFGPRRFSCPPPPRFRRHLSTYAESPPSVKLGLLTEKPVLDYGGGDGEYLDNIDNAVAKLAEVLAAVGDSDAMRVVEILDAKGKFLLRSHVINPVLELMFRLSSYPLIALEVFKWKRRQAQAQVVVLMPEEFAKAISLAGQTKNIDLAFQLFTEATNKGIHSTSVYNALMTSYLCNGFTKKSLSLFKDLKKDSVCRPTIVTFNILLSIFGHSMMVDDMDEVMKTIKDQNLIPNVSTYNTLIAGYLTAWMWDHMEKSFYAMQECSIRPNTRTYLLMLRGYAHSGNLGKMERTYELVKDQVNESNTPLIRAMICAYCKSSNKDRIKKIEALLKLIPEGEYRPWLNVLLIRVYAEEDLMEGMESNIGEALQRNTRVTTIGIMRSIIGSYFRCDALDRLELFVKQAELAGWRLCQSLYHCKMVMYGCQNRLEEMESVLDEMENARFDRTKKTYWIMYKAYKRLGEKSKVARVLGLMFKRGYEIPLDTTGWI